LITNRLDLVTNRYSTFISVMFSETFYSGGAKYSSNLMWVRTLFLARCIRYNIMW